MSTEPALTGHRAGPNEAAIGGSASDDGRTTAPGPRPEGREPGPLGPLVREFLAEEHAASPVMASGLGLTQFDGRLDDLSAGA